MQPSTTQPDLIRLKCQRFYDAQKSIGGDDPEFLKNLFEATGKPQAFHFYCLTAQFKHNGHAIETMRSRYVITPATGARADKLIA